MAQTITPFTDAVKNLVEAAHGTPKSRNERLKLESELQLNDARMTAAEAQAASSQATAAKTRAALDAMNKLSPELFRLDAPINVPAQELPPDVFGPAAPAGERVPTQAEVLDRGSQLASILAQSGNLNAGNLGALLNTVEGSNANIGVVDKDARLRNAAAGAGKPFSVDQVQAQDFVKLPQQERTLAAQLKAFGEITPRNITFANEAGERQNRIGIGPGFINEQGRFTIPQGDAAVFTAKTQAATPGEAIGLTKSVIGDVQKKQLGSAELGDFSRTYLNFVEQVNPDSFGAIGGLTSLTQDISQQFDAATGAGSSEFLKNEAARIGAELLANDQVTKLRAEDFNPQLVTLEQMHNIFVYKVAEGLAGQSGRALSDADIERAEKMVGGGPFDLLASKPKLTAGISNIININNHLSAGRAARTNIQLGEPQEDVPSPLVPGQPLQTAPGWTVERVD